MDKQILLNRNEITQGPAPKCLEVLGDFPIEKLARYFDGYFGSDLIPVLSKKFNIPEQQIILGYGLEDIFRLIFDSLKPGFDIVLTHNLHYTYYDKYLDFKGVKIENFNLIEKQNEYIFDVDNCISKTSELRPRIILITSPNNPTGNSIVAFDLERILQNTSKETLVVLDEAYYGFDDSYDEASFIALLKQYSNLMILRSFSKLYALAGMRMGFALCGKEVKSLLRFQNSYLGGSRLLEEIAIAALESTDYYSNLSGEIIADRKRFSDSVKELDDFKVFDSKANFVLIKVAESIKTNLEHLLESQDILISKFVTDNLMRVSISSKQYTNALSEILRKVSNNT